MLNDEKRRRFARHLILPEIGISGQEHLSKNKALIVGVGGLGSAAAGYLSAMGVGALGLVDADRVELSNLQRQILFEEADIGQLKVKAAAARLQECNAEIDVRTYPLRLEESNGHPAFLPPPIRGRVGVGVKKIGVGAKSAEI